MTAYRYRALNTDGKLVRGVMEGDSERQVRAQLRSQNMRPVEIGEANRALHYMFSLVCFYHFSPPLS